MSVVFVAKSVPTVYGGAEQRMLSSSPVALRTATIEMAPKRQRYLLPPAKLTPRTITLELSAA
eukprot:3300058-Prymnesium_polylepis.1